jgi:hypothetical protein
MVKCDVFFAVQTELLNIFIFEVVGRLVCPLDSETYAGRVTQAGQNKK